MLRIELRVILGDPFYNSKMQLPDNFNNPQLAAIGQMNERPILPPFFEKCATSSL